LNKHSPLPWNNTMCKDKWGVMYGDFWLNSLVTW
jgi:hypothetical protein